jgi:hypothetical protein
MNGTKTPSRSRLGLFTSSVLALLLIAPTQIHTGAWNHDRLAEVSVLPILQPEPVFMAADLDANGSIEALDLQDGSATIRQGDDILWRSPADWTVVDAQITDLNRDGDPEATLLLWRAFSPWPIDRYIAHPGRIDDFHDSAGQSCHMVLIGWLGEEFDEFWAGSAQVDPFSSFRAFDLNSDGSQELLALEGNYDDPFPSIHALTVWEWNGFGFSLLSRGPAGRFDTFITGHAPDHTPLVLLQGP